MELFTNMTSHEFVCRFNKLQDKTCSNLIAKIQTEDMVYIYHINGYRVNAIDLDLFAYSTAYGYWVFTNREDRVLVTPKTLKLMAKFTKQTYKSCRK